MKRCRLLQLLLLLGVALGCGHTLASEPAAPAPAPPAPEDALGAGWPAQLAPAQTLTFQLLPERFRHRPRLRHQRAPRANARPEQAPRPPASDAEPALQSETMAYADRAALVTRLRELDGLRLITFWDSPMLSVFFGLSRDGFAGLNIRQNRLPRRQRQENRTEAQRPDMTLVEAPSLLADSGSRP